MTRDRKKVLATIMKLFHKAAAQQEFAEDLPRLRKGKRGAKIGELPDFVSGVIRKANHGESSKDQV